MADAASCHAAQAYRAVAIDRDVLAGDRALDVAAGLGGEVDDHRPGRMPATMSAVTSSGAGRPGDGRRGDQTSACGDVRREQLALAARPVLAELPGVAAGALDAPRGPG